MIEKKPMFNAGDMVRINKHVKTFENKVGMVLGVVKDILDDFAYIVEFENEIQGTKRIVAPYFNLTKVSK